MPDASLDRAAAAFIGLVEVMRRLRAPDGCPWDRAQTWTSLSPFVLEETYEVIDAIERNDADALKHEVGDLLFEAVFLAQVGDEADAFTVADSLESIVAKLVRRHPHVFARHEPESGSPETPRDVEVRWEELKASERAASNTPHTTLGGIARSLPALLRAYEIGQRAAAVGFDWTHPGDVVAKMHEELTEVTDAIAADGADSAHAEEEMGDLLFALANLSRKLGIEPEAALRRANDKFTRRFNALEAAVKARGAEMKQMTLDELEREWQTIKRHSPQG